MDVQCELCDVLFISTTMEYPQVCIPCKQKTTSQSYLPDTSERPAFNITLNETSMSFLHGFSEPFGEQKTAETSEQKVAAYDFDLAKTARCLICYERCYPNCDKCLVSALCTHCKQTIRNKTDALVTSMQRSCKWCNGSTDINDYCNECKERWDKRVVRELRLGAFILSKKYGTKNVEQEMRKKNMWKCDCLSGINCNCVLHARAQVRAEYGIEDFEILDYCPVEDGWDGEYDMCGSICARCQKERLAKLEQNAQKTQVI